MRNVRTIQGGYRRKDEAAAILSDNLDLRSRRSKLDNNFTYRQQQQINIFSDYIKNNNYTQKRHSTTAKHWWRTICIGGVGAARSEKQSQKQQLHFETQQQQSKEQDAAWLEQRLLTE